MSVVERALTAVARQLGEPTGFAGRVVGLDLLLDCDGTVVHGVEMSETMLTEARRRFSDYVARGRLRLYSGHGAFHLLVCELPG